MTAKHHVAAEDSPPDQLWRWSARRLAWAIRTGQVSAREATAACLDRVAEVNPQLNALAEVSPDEAAVSAAVADRAVAAGQPLGPLHGVPVATKINSDQAGHATTNGVVAFKNNVSDSDSPQVEGLREAGAVMLGRSNTPAFSHRWFTANDLHGRTLNPWDRRHTPGGSSGGSASAVASGMVPIAQGNDLGGSIRYPAYACGVVGIRPTPGRIPARGGPRGADRPLSISLMAVQGALARTVADLRLALDAMSRFHPSDAFSVELPPSSANPSLGRPVRVALVRDVGVRRPVSAVNDALGQAADWLSDAGYVVEEVELPLLAEAFRLWYLLFLEDFRPMLPMVDKLGDEAIKTSMTGLFAAAEDWWGASPDLAACLKGYARRGTLIGELQTFLHERPLLLLPVSAEQAFEYDADIASPERGREVIEAQWSMMALSVLGFPAVSVPTGQVGGLPTGVQLVGRRFREDTVFDAAEVIDARAGAITPVDPLH